jgi:NAD-dependent DNA ligase
MMADGQLNDSEIKFLNMWLLDNKELSSCWPGQVIYVRIREVLADNIITEAERKYLEQTLSDLIGGTLQEIGAAFGAATTLPVEYIEDIIVEQHNFCFTGEFLFGSRKTCEKAVISRGGNASPSVRLDLDYLVVGTMANAEWANTSHGRKIEKAIEYKGRGQKITIVSEKNWIECL